MFRVESLRLLWISEFLNKCICWAVFNLESIKDKLTNRQNFIYVSNNRLKEYAINLFEKVQRCLGVVAQQVVKNQTQACQVEGHGLQLGVFALCHFSDGLGDQGEDCSPAALRQIVEQQQQELEVLDIEVVFSVHRTLYGVLLQRSQESIER